MCLSTVLDYVPVVKLSLLSLLVTYHAWLLFLTYCFLPWPLSIPTSGCAVHCGTIAESQSARREPFLFVHRPRFVIHQS